MLVGLIQTKASLRIDDDAQDPHLEFLIKAASARVLHHIDADQDFLDTNGDPEEDTDGVATDIPEDVQVAVIYLVGVFLRDPDGENSAKWEQGFLPPAVTSILYPYRTPTLA
jgi:hypothetical protein